MCRVPGNSGTPAKARRAVPQGQGTPRILLKSASFQRGGDSAESEGDSVIGSAATKEKSVFLNEEDGLAEISNCGFSEQRWTTRLSWPECEPD